MRVVRRQGRPARAVVRDEEAPVRAVAKTYSGVRFRSTLEADWALNLDQLDIAWQYEPQAFVLRSGKCYAPDFYLPDIDTWLEVKGPGVPGLDKTAEFAKQLRPLPEPYAWHPVRMVVGVAATNGALTWLDEDVHLATCEACGGHFWFHMTGIYTCRRCGTHEGDHHLAQTWQSGVMPFARIPYTPRGRR